jgi:hypothetical protein
MPKFHILAFGIQRSALNGVSFAKLLHLSTHVRPSIFEPHTAAEYWK